MDKCSAVGKELASHFPDPWVNPGPDPALFWDNTIERIKICQFQLKLKYNVEPL